MDELLNCLEDLESFDLNSKQALEDLKSVIFNRENDLFFLILDRDHCFTVLVFEDPTIIEIFVTVSEILLDEDSGTKVMEPHQFLDNWCSVQDELERGFLNPYCLKTDYLIDLFKLFDKFH